MKRLTIMTLCLGALATGAVGCKHKKTDGASGDTASAKPAAGNLPALTADPDPGAITPAETQPFDAVKFGMTANRNAHGWPKYAGYNYGTKVITAIAITGYAYDASGKQVARTQTPMSWNGKLAPGGKTDWDIEIGMSGPDVPASAASYEVCFDSIKFDGDAAWTEDNSRCPDQKPKAH